MYSGEVDDGAGFHVYLAQKYGALIVSLEHRFYGQSIPFYGECGHDCLNLTNLQYLSSEQALSDLSVFIEFIKTNRYNSLNINKTIIIGGSYAGAMSAWMRSLYSDFVDAALASSGPVNATEDFYQYDQSVSTGLHDDQCVQNIHLAVNASDIDIDNNFDTVKKVLGCQVMSNKDDMRYALADAVAYAVQYNKETGSDQQRLRRNLCDIMNGTDEPAQKYYRFFNSLIRNLSTDCDGFADTREQLSDTTGVDGESGRQWYWQSCREFGFFQTAPAQNPLRSPHIDLPYHHDLCAYIFNASYSVPDTAGTNARYGGVNPKGTEIDFTNGELDPWHVLSIYPDQPTTAPSSSSPGLTAPNGTSADSGSGAMADPNPNWGVYMVKGGSHCSDLTSPGSDSMTDDIARVQALVYADLSKWIAAATAPAKEEKRKSETEKKTEARAYSGAFMAPHDVTVH